ncbi:AraC family transcriptional regulator ligand-binding domain-containing protein [Desulfovibrio aminophilus]|uniref:AraC family transcriptional regulator n=1 Tax=Desulfovibrio aminophilus TaxID=81425 RepID=UPI00339A79A5
MPPDLPTPTPDIRAPIKIFPTIRATAVLGLFELVESTKQLDFIFRKSGINPRQVRDRQQEIPLSNFLLLLANAAQSTNDGAFGLHLGLRSQLPDLGLLGYIMLNSPNVYEALRQMTRYYNYHQRGAEISLEPSGDTVHLVYGLSSQTEHLGRREDAEMSLASYFSFVKDLVGMPTFPAEVLFEHPEPPYSGEHIRLFRCPVRFCRPENALIYKKTSLFRPVARADHELLKVLLDYMAQLVSERPRDEDMVGHVQYHVARMLRNGNLDFDRLTTVLGVSSRTLRRRLALEGTSFRELVTRTRLELARDYLTHPSMTVTEVAYLLGYASSSAFSRALRKLTGMTPREFRQKFDH